MPVVVSKTSYSINLNSTGIHLQHATSDQLLDLGLVSKNIWNDYFKFTFVRNPYDRAYSDYLWIQEDRKIKGSFKDYITKSGAFKKVLSNNSIKEYRGDHLLQQTDFFDFKQMNFIGRFENLLDDISHLKKMLHLNKDFNYHTKRSGKRKSHYSLFYNKEKKELVEKYFKKDINLLNYTFKDKRTGLHKLKEWV